MTLRGEPSLLWRAVDQHGAELDILLQKRREKAAAKQFFKRVLASRTIERDSASVSYQRLNSSSQLGPGSFR